MIDIISKLNRIMSKSNLETFDPGTDSLEAIREALDSLQGLVFYGVVDAVPGANQFTISGLAGLGAGKFVGANPWSAYVFRDAGGAAAAPQGEFRTVTAYATATGNFTTNAFTAAVGIGDEILIIHPYLVASGINPVDGVYFDEVLGVAGTGQDVGTPQNPVNNLADALTIMAARNLSKLVLSGSGVHMLTLTTGFDYQIVGNPAYTITIAAGAAVNINGELDCLDLVNTTGNVAIQGKLYAWRVNNTGTGSIQVEGFAEVALVVNSGLGTINFEGGSSVQGGWDNTGGGSIGIIGGTFIGGALTLDGAALCTIYGPNHINQLIHGSTGAMLVNGKLIVPTSVAVTGGGDLTVQGDFECEALSQTGAGAIRVIGFTRIGLTGVVNSGLGEISFEGGYEIAGPWDNSGGGDCNNIGKGEVAGITLDGVANFYNTGDIKSTDITSSSVGGTIYIEGDLRISNGITLTDACALEVMGKSEITGDVATVAGATVLFHGKARIYGEITGAGDVDFWGERFATGIYYNADGEAGQAYPIGEKDRPVNNRADLLAILDANPQIDLVHLNSGIVLQNGDRLEAVAGGVGYRKYVGTTTDATITFVTGVDIDHCEFENLGLHAATRVAANLYAKKCNISGSWGYVFATNCGIGDINAEAVEFHDCWNMDEYSESDIDLTSMDDDCKIFGFKGRLVFMNHGTYDTFVVMNGGQIRVDVTSEDGDIYIYGNARIIDESGGTGIIDYTIEKNLQDQLLSMDFWSEYQEEVHVAQAAGTLTLPNVTVADLPAGAVVVRSIAMFKTRAVENTNGAANKLDGATVAATSQVIQVRDDTPGVWRDSINFVDDLFGIGATTREGGEVMLGQVDIAVEVDGNDTYNFQWLLAKADQDHLNFNDVQVGLRVWYRVNN